MDNSVLNKAHQQHRIADKHLRFHRFSDAMDCHDNAIEFLTDALQCTNNHRSLESIKLQIDFHERQKNLIKIKKQQHEDYKLAFDSKFSNTDSTDGSKITDAIYQTIEETDSLIEFIENSSTDAKEVKPSIAAVKHPKDDKTVIEEFKILNKQLHLLISKLVNQLDISRKENELLKNRLKQYENETESDHLQPSNLKLTADSSGGTSPYVFSPCSEVSSGVQEIIALPSASNNNMDEKLSSDATDLLVKH